ncbi:MAG: GEVED domain-containing protein, partial [Bacteroidota bacterium]
LNGNETGVDCGGPDCAACPTCSDGIQNGNETGVDCGGPDCAACPTCSDGIQNGNETGVDCGGPDCSACPVNYCSSAGTNTNFEFIQAVGFNGQTNTSGSNGGYADFTGSVTFNASTGGSASVVLTPGFVGQSYNEFWSVYIDYNADGDFTDAGELAFQSAGSNTRTGTITIPTGAAIGSTRMRVQMQWNAYTSSSCQTFQYGEVEDYTLNISGGSRLNTPDAPVNAKRITPAELELFPNPVQSELTVRIPLQNEEPQANWMVLDATGKVVRSGVAKAATLRGGLTVDVRNLAAGMYYLSLNGKVTRVTKRFVVQP